MAASVLVLGGGFAGLAAVRELARRVRAGLDVSVRLVDERPYSLFSPMLPDVISGRVSADHLRYPLAPYCRWLGVEFIQAAVQEISPGGGLVRTDREVLDADYMIVCLGCKTNYFGDEQMAARAPGLKSVEEGLAIRADAARRVQCGAGGITQRQRAHFVVVGGGYTGFEAASHLAHLLRRLTGLPYGRLKEACGILILERGKEALRNVSPAARLWALDLIRGYGLEVRTGVSIQAFEPDGSIRVSDGSVLGNAAVIWTAGVTPGPAVSRMESAKGQGGRLAVDECLRLRGAGAVFAAGDVAAAMPQGTEAPLRMAVQFSLAGGRCAAVNVARAVEGRPPLPFRPADLGYVVPLAPGHAAGMVLGRELHGRLPYGLHYLMCILRSWGWRNRAGVLGDLFTGGRYDE